MGRQLGRYELLRPIARGGMAEVYLARRRGPGGVEKQLVVKRIAREKSRDPRFAELFVVEAQLSMSLAHKNIVPVFDFGRAGDELFLVMEFVDGIDLGKALKRGQELGSPPSGLVVAYIGLEAALALDYAHTRKKAVIHRDVTPGNVLLSSSGEVKLVDFGVAALASDALGNGKVQGTPAYMSPEQARGETVDRRSDLFSLGLVLWEALAGRRAYQGASNAERIAAATAAEVPALPDSVAAPLRAIVERATALDPADRFESAREMYRALDRYLLSARAEADVDDLPPTTQLSSWVEAVQPEIPELSDGEIPAADGQVVTYLDAGADGLRTFANTEPSNATMRSMAETVVGDEGSAADNPALAATERIPVPGADRRRRSPLWIAAIAVLAVPVAWFGWRAIRSQPAAPAAIDAGSAHASPTHLADASPVPEAPPDSSPIDAGLADAGMARPARGDAGSRTPPKPDDAEVDGLGTVRVSSAPWAKVTVVGRKEGCPETPCSIQLPAGRHRLVLVNPGDGRRAEAEVTVEKGGVHQVHESIPAPR